MANGDFVSLTRSGSNLTVKSTTGNYSFSLPGTQAAPPPPAPVVVDPTAAIAALKTDLDARVDGVLAAVNALTALLQSQPTPTPTPTPAPTPGVDTSKWLSTQTLVAGGTTTLLAGTEKASTNVAVAQTVTGAGMRKSMLDGQGGVGAGNRLSWGKGIQHIMAGPYTGNDFGLLNGGGADGSSDGEAGIYIGDVTAPFTAIFNRLAFDGNENGVFMQDQSLAPVDLYLNSCVFGRLKPNGLLDGRSHDMYVAGKSVTIRKCIFVGNSNGNTIKCRGPFLRVEDSIVGRTNGRWIDAPGGTNIVSNRNRYFTTVGANVQNALGFFDEGDTNAGRGQAGSFVSTDDEFWFTRFNEVIWINSPDFVVSFSGTKVFWVGPVGAAPPTVTIQGPGQISGTNPFILDASMRRDALPAIPADPVA